MPKTTTGSSIRSSLEYDLASKNGEPGGEWICGSLSGSAREMARQAALFRSLRPDCQKAIWSVSLSLPPSDGRQSPEKWAEVVHSFFKKMDINPNKYAWAAHRHTHQNDHIHIRLCRVASDGGLWNQEHSAKRAIKACAELEGEFDLNKHDRTPSPKTRPSRAEIEISKRKGKPMSREKIQEVVNKVIAGYPEGIGFETFQGLLRAENIEVLPYAPGGELKGVSYAFDGFKWPGSKIGREYSTGLSGRGVRFGVTSNVAVQVPPKAAQAPSQSPRDRVPAMVRKTITQPGQSALNINTTPTSRAVWDDTSTGAGTKALLELGLWCLQLAQPVLNALLKFLNWLFAKVGLKLGPATPGSDQAETALPFAPQIIEAEARVVPDRRAFLAMNKIATELGKVKEALEKNDPTLLPPGPATAELAEAMAVKSTPLSLGAGGVDSNVEISTNVENEQLTKSTKIAIPTEKLDALKDAVVLILTAQREIDQTTWGVDSVQVVAARAELIEAQAALASAAAADTRTRAAASAPTRWLMPAAGVVLKSYQKRFDEAVAGLDIASKQYPQVPPKHLTQAVFSASRQAVPLAKAAVAAMKDWVESLEDAEIKKFARGQTGTFVARVAEAEQSLLQPNLFRNAAEAGYFAIKNIAARQAEIERVKLAAAMQAQLNDEDQAERFADVLEHQKG